MESSKIVFVSVTPMICISPAFVYNAVDVNKIVINLTAFIPICASIYNTLVDC